MTEQFVQSVYSANTPADERASLKTLIIENNHDITRQPTFIKLDPSQPVDAIPDAMYGGGLTADAHHITAPHPEGEGAEQVMKTTIEDAFDHPPKGRRI